MERETFGGVVTPILTPIGPDGDLDVESLERLVEFQINEGVDGIFVLGTMGEGGMLTNTQKREVVRTVADLIAPELSLFVGVSDTSLTRVAENIAAFAPYRVDAFVCTLPYFTPVAEDEQFGFFLELQAVADRPVIAYNIPSFVKSSLSIDVVERLSESGMLAGIKESTDNPERYGSLAKIVSRFPCFRVFTGHPSMIITAHKLGFAGIVVGLSNVIPKSCVAVDRLWTAGSEQSAKDLYADILEVFEAIFDLRNLDGYNNSLPIIKAVAAELGLISCPNLLPPYEPARRRHWDRIVSVCERIKSLEDKSQTILHNQAIKETKVKCNQAV